MKLSDQVKYKLKMLKDLGFPSGTEPTSTLESLLLSIENLENIIKILEKANELQIKMQNKLNCGKYNNTCIIDDVKIANCQECKQWELIK